MNPAFHLRARATQHFVASGRTLLVTDLLGQIGAGLNEGLFVDNTRLVAREELHVDGREAVFFAASPTGGGALLAYGQVPGDGVARQSVFVEQTRTLSQGMRTRWRFTNYSSSSVILHVELRVEADFADTEETHQGTRLQDAPVELEWDEDRHEATLRYAHPEVDRAALVSVEQGRATRIDGTLQFEVRVPARGHHDIVVAVRPLFDGTPGLPTSGIAGEARTLGAVQHELAASAPRLLTTNVALGQAWTTAVSDLAGLALGLPSGPATPSAGLPLYQYLFGRDTLTTAWQAAMALPRIAADSLAANAAYQGRRIDDWHDEEPGKLIHQARAGVVSELGKNPFKAYFGDYATPADFLILLGQHLAWTGDVEVTRRLLPAARGALSWLERFGDLDGDGFLEYVKRSSHGVKNQGWKDSDDAIVDEQGNIVDNPIATCELQGYWYIALRQGAFAFLRAGDRAYALRLLRQARNLQRRFDEAFWLSDEGSYALALGPDKQPIRSVTSNPGHLLATGIVPRDKAHHVIARLMAPDMFSGWGIRTLSSEHVAYNPYSYHLGSVWPVENATFLLGFVRYGAWDAAHRLAEGFLAATDLFIANRLPESIGGLPRDAEHPHSGIYPEANEPQAWSASAVILVVQALLGLRPVAPAGLLLVDPHLPEWLPDLRLQGVRVGRAVVDLDVRRERRGRTRLRHHVPEGHLRILRQPPPQTRIRNPLRRALAAGEHVFV